MEFDTNIGELVIYPLAFDSKIFLWLHTHRKPFSYFGRSFHFRVRSVRTCIYRVAQKSKPLPSIIIKSYIKNRH